jgi:xanthine dehydrogenase accessory factor
MNSVYLKILGSEQELSRLVLATIISTRGSTPQRPGSSALFNLGELVDGTVGGGVLEGRVQKIALEAARSKYSGIRHFDLDKDISFSDEAICGGQASVLIDAGVKDHLDVFKKAADLLQRKIPCVLVTRILYTDTEKIEINRSVISKVSGNTDTEEHGELIDQEVKRLLSSKEREYFSRHDSGKPGEEGSMSILFEPLFPASQLIIAGAGHIGKALSHIGRLLDFEVTVIDDRPEFANHDNLPDADKVITGDIGEALGEIKKSADTYIVIVTRGHKDDANALRSCITTEAAYVGMIGSRTKIAQLHDSFIKNGWSTEKQWAAIHAPVGLKINSQTVGEIAVSIAAELILVRNERKN